MIAFSSLGSTGLACHDAIHQQFVSLLDFSLVLPSRALALFTLPTLFVHLFPFHAKPCKAHCTPLSLSHFPRFLPVFVRPSLLPKCPIAIVFFWLLKLLAALTQCHVTSVNECIFSLSNVSLLTEAGLFPRPRPDLRLRISPGFPDLPMCECV